MPQLSIIFLFNKLIIFSTMKKNWEYFDNLRYIFEMGEKKSCTFFFFSLDKMLTSLITLTTNKIHQRARLQKTKTVFIQMILITTGLKGHKNLTYH